MPTNGFADGILYTINEIPVFTYSMITLTAAVLSYVTFMDTPEIPSENPLETSSETPNIPAAVVEEPPAVDEEDITPSPVFQEEPPAVDEEDITPSPVFEEEAPTVNETEIPSAPAVEAKTSPVKTETTGGKKRKRTIKRKPNTSRKTD